MVPLLGEQVTIPVEDADRHGRPLSGPIGGLQLEPEDGSYSTPVSARTTVGMTMRGLRMLRNVPSANVAPRLLVGQAVTVWFHIAETGASPAYTRCRVRGGDRLVRQRALALARRGSRTPG